MINNLLRIGNFTSSEIVALTSRDKAGTGFGVPALTYLAECNMERKLGRSVTDEVNARPLTWGSVLEPMVHEKLPLDYIFTSQETKAHPLYDFWAGSKDGLKRDAGRTVTDIKNPMTLKSFCTLVDPLYDGLTGIDAINAVRNGYKDSNGIAHPKHKDGEKYYWQLVSNACIEVENGESAAHCELIIHMPYRSQMGDVKLLADGNPNAYWIAMGGDDELPYLLDDGYYKDMNIIRFTPSQADKDFLADCVEKASQLLIERL